MKVLVDTNIVLRIGVARASPAAIARALEQIALEGKEPCVSLQSMTEVWAVLTRPATANGFGLTAAQARAEVDQIVNAFELLPEPAGRFAAWLRICTDHQVLGRQTFDARLVALMECGRIDTLVTLNPVDFQRFKSIKLIVPA